ncbi:hypothetical protein K227x_53270 [Rubripirellula lacrimiformis]|uniref:Uncharacterized protein n=1 Tax=Rubripirellula lacrimiformis TaxID=1930273 RepID=A0A517NIE5_9BACT|nr:hypothetical protein [Rubripirellula lacrimiformis]QDT06904.1 hypothetical protein K227x_53270 [Rubripirellula lacrimiformis]
MSHRDDAIARLTIRIAERLGIDQDRIRWGPLPSGRGKLGTSGDHWQIWYRAEWRELPWHFDGPDMVTREMIRRHYGDPTADEASEPPR